MLQFFRQIRLLLRTICRDKVISHKRYANYKNVENYTSNLEDMFCWPIRAWVSGHSHHQKEVRLQIDDPPTDEGEIVMGANAHQGDGNPEQTLTFRIIPPILKANSGLNLMPYSSLAPEPT
jgi:hypothetical protein